MTPHFFIVINKLDYILIVLFQSGFEVNSVHFTENDYNIHE